MKSPALRLLHGEILVSLADVMDVVMVLVYQTGVVHKILILSMSVSFSVSLSLSFSFSGSLLISP